MMIRALWSAATGMRAQQQNIDAIANDLTNVNTNGYKKRLLNFADLMYQSVRASGVQGAADGNRPVGIQLGHGVRLVGTTPIFTTGSADETGLWSDMMINGNDTNFFSVTLADGTPAYTRDGSFRVNDEGELTTSEGLSLNPPITGIPTGAIDPTITESGEVQYYTETGGDIQTAGQVMLYSFMNPAGLDPMGDNLWLETASSGAAVQGTPNENGFGSILGGYVETSNVDAITEMVNMIAAQRSYEFNSRSIQASDEMLQTVNSLKQ